MHYHACRKSKSYRVRSGRSLGFSENSSCVFHYSCDQDPEWPDFHMTLGQPSPASQHGLAVDANISSTAVALKANGNEWDVPVRSSSSIVVSTAFVESYYSTIQTSHV